MKLTPKQIATIKSDLQDGTEVAALAERFGVSKDTIRAILPRQGKVKVVLTQEQRAEIVAARAAGAKRADLATKYGVTEIAIYRVLKAAP